MNTDNTKLKMTFDPKTIEHLGIKMYSTLPPVLSELVANAYDAGATTVKINLKDDGLEKEISVIDNGSGMTLNDMNDNFLVIGRNRRSKEDLTPIEGRKPIGKKGLGKLAFFGIADRVEVHSRRNGFLNAFSMDWKRIKAWPGNDYEPDIIRRQEQTEKRNGTKVILKGIKRKTDFDHLSVASSLSKIFLLDKTFRIYVSRNGGKPTEVTNQLRFEELDIQVK